MGKTILLKNASLLTEEAECISSQNVYVKDGKIEKILPGDRDDGSLKAEETIDCSSYYVSPGLANLHTHTAMNIFKGIAEDVTADAWFNEMIWPYESKMTDDDVYIGTLLGIAEMLNNGVTVFADHYFGEEQVLKAVKETGIRGIWRPRFSVRPRNSRSAWHRLKSLLRTTGTIQIRSPSIWAPTPIIPARRLPWGRSWTKRRLWIFPSIFMYPRRTCRWKRQERKPA